MSYFLLNVGEHALASKSPLIKAEERIDFSNAAELLCNIEHLKTQTAAAYSDAQKQGYADGLAAGIDAVKAEFRAEIEQFAKAISSAEASRHEQIATAAIAGAQAIVGAIDQTEAMRGIISQVLKRIDKDQAITVHIHADHFSELQENGEFPSNITLVSNPSLGPTDCEIVSANGKIIANMELQLAGLAQRWGVINIEDTQEDE
jgi:flagellar biosynthesis/type III secretory pathway protein FliH